MKTLSMTRRDFVRLGVGAAVAGAAAKATLLETAALAAQTAHVGPLFVAVGGRARCGTGDEVVPERAEPAREAHRRADPGINRGAERRSVGLLRQGRDQIGR